MGHFRQIVLLLSSLAVLFASGLGQGFVLCVGEDGAVRVEASNTGKSCLLTSAAGVELTSRPSDSEIGLGATCSGCHDLGFADRSSRVTSTADQLLEATPLVLAWLVTQAGLSVEPATRPSQLDSPPLGERWSDLYAVRETIILLI
jgi:hypothetical protein